MHVEEFVNVVVEQKVEDIDQVLVVQTQERIVQNPLAIEVEIPRPQLIEKTIEMPKVQIEVKITKVPQGTNTVVDSTVQNQVQTIEMLKPKAVQKIVQRKTPIILDEDQQVPKFVEQAASTQRILNREVPISQRAIKNSNNHILKY